MQKGRNRNLKRILVCEDEDVIRDFVVINLKRAGYDVTDVNCGEEALKTFDAEHGNFDIVLLDIMMPGIDGFTVCKKLRERSSTLGIIMLTAKAQEMDKVSGLMIGADDYITKPFSVRELIARVKALLRRAAPEEPENHTHRRGQQKQDEPDELIGKLTWFIVDMHRKEQRADLYDAVGQRQILLHEVGDCNNKSDLHGQKEDHQHDAQRRRNAPLALLLNLESLHRSLSPLLLAVPCF